MKPGRPGFAFAAPEPGLSAQKSTIFERQSTHCFCRVISSSRASRRMLDSTDSKCFRLTEAEYSKTKRDMMKRLKLAKMTKVSQTFTRKDSGLGIENGGHQCDIGPFQFQELLRLIAIYSDAVQLHLGLAGNLL